MKVIVFRLCLFALFVLGAASSPLKAKTHLRVVAPYLPENVENDGKQGRDIEIFRKVTDCMGITVEIEVQPYMRHIKSYRSDSSYDAIMTIPTTEMNIDHRTENYVSYHNGVIVRKEEFPHGINDIKDLKGKSVISFLGSKDLLKGIAGNLDIFKSYTETALQYRHNEMLMKERVDGVFSDGLIFMAHQKRLIEKEPRWKKVPVKFYSLFSLNHFSAAFKEKKWVRSFNKCLNRLREELECDKIEKKYAKKYEGVLGKEYLLPLLHHHGH